jgi:hypothetical protein
MELTDGYWYNGFTFLSSLTSFGPGPSIRETFVFLDFHIYQISTEIRFISIIVVICSHVLEFLKS